MGAVPWVIMSEIFPINIKGTAGGLVTLVNWAGAWAVSYTFNFLLTWSSYGKHIVLIMSCFKKSKMLFSSHGFGRFYDFHPKVCFPAFSGSKRFEILPFSSGSLTPSFFLR
ncbi:putative major facilitator, sugar transporter, major facilitator superfamily [Helianthus annuus]|nr:putative major facilitator, sugar transporter, major facilitator superfamily [Helianthus annuus]